MKKITSYLPVLLMILVLGFLWFYIPQMSETNSARQKQLLENALDKSIVQCYALEGTYPPSISYLEEHYGIIYNHDTFFVDYQYVGGNLRPDVTVIERK